MMRVASSIPITMKHRKQFVIHRTYERDVNRALRARDILDAVLLAHEGQAQMEIKHTSAEAYMAAIAVEAHKLKILRKPITKIVALDSIAQLLRDRRYAHFPTDHALDVLACNPGVEDPGRRSAWRWHFRHEQIADTGRSETPTDQLLASP